MSVLTSRCTVFSETSGNARDMSFILEAGDFISTSFIRALRELVSDTAGVGERGAAGEGVGFRGEGVVTIAFGVSRIVLGAATFGMLIARSGSWK